MQFMILKINRFAPFFVHVMFICVLHEFLYKLQVNEKKNQKRISKIKKNMN